MSHWQRVILIAASLPVLAIFFGFAVLGWGDLTGFLAHPARAGLMLATILFVIITLLSSISLSGGQREDIRNRWIFAPLALVILAFAFLPPYADRRDLLTLDGDAVRYLGLALYIIGGGLRLWAIYALGHRFSGLVAIQENHLLLTTGLYGFIRHPSYLGAVLAMMGWTLVFRSALVLVLVPILIWVVIARIEAEERLLASQFGAAYTTYRRRTWRLIPFVY